MTNSRRRMPVRCGRASAEWLAFALAGAASLAASLLFFRQDRLLVRPDELGPWTRLAVMFLSAWVLLFVLGGWTLADLQRRRRARAAAARRRDAAQREQAERIELALAGADLGLWDWNLASGRREVNGRGASMLGYAPDEIDTVDAFYRDVHPEDVAPVRAALERHLRGEARRYEAEFRLRHRTRGWVWVHCRGKVIERDAAGRPLRLLGTRMDISARKQAEREIHHLACYDPLSTLPNRRLLLERLDAAAARAAREHRHGAVLLVDLDHFKAINDGLGHDAGDRVIRAVAARLRAAVRDGGSVARLGGDEFAVLLDALDADPAAALAQAAATGEELLRKLGRPHRVGKREVYATPSIGAALFGAGGGRAGDLLKQADLAMCAAKAAGRHALRFFDPAMQQRVAESALLEADLRAALGTGQFLLHYQPIVDAGLRILGAEALVRWQHPRRGMVRPDAFIALAERTGLIVPLGQHVMEQACAQLARWARQARTAAWTLSVNVSARQFRQPGFVERTLQTLARSGADPALLKLELTESALLEDIDDVAAKMQSLRAHGIRFSLDDFGTGYSSLSYLKRLPLCQLKIDRTFVQDAWCNASDAAIARAIIALAGSLGLEVVAEGVETAAQRDFLVASGCTVFQGYLFGRPVPALGDAALAA
ncbi:bifunctional diguanylate cyclase/phosphodiesterase [uncultured Massilia sp.]|uniref:putative bifunctional diguanylate cyclase/phosphodiesterase n=1 Tax=uncultured Massilia sp. TaxID=169973 RepID=UPI0025E9CAF2|nr:GGDEF domain-containing phosphodiesterase [uncultured Massilia sp.]